MVQHTQSSTTTKQGSRSRPQATGNRAGQSESRGGAAQQKAARKVAAARDQLTRAGEQLSGRLQSAEESVSGCIQDRPLGSVFVACALGVAIGAVVFAAVRAGMSSR